MGIVLKIHNRPIPT